MTARGWLVATRRGGRGYYGLTPRGRRLLEEGRQRIYHPPRHVTWDGAWYLVAYSIPETRRAPARQPALASSPGSAAAR